MSGSSRIKEENRLGDKKRILGNKQGGREEKLNKIGTSPRAARIVPDQDLT